MRYKIVFFNSINDEEYIIKQNFESIIEVNKYITDCEYDYQDIAIDENGNEYWKTFYRFYCSENKENYTSYEIRELL
jgi:hypothetical protein